MERRRITDLVELVGSGIGFCTRFLEGARRKACCTPWKF
uniref:Uncharacterized protein n=1 Tax=Arundo donax TaxID=35708 RepID=A0A0A9EI81_ARUDO